MSVLISGAGIAGPTLAYWLARYGFAPTIVEKSPTLRTGGYIIDFWGAGFEIAERMGLAPEITERGYRVQEVRVVGRDGRRVAGFSATAFARATQGRFTSLPRGELAASIVEAIVDRVEIIFGDSVAALEQCDSGVRVQFEGGATRDFDLVIGADGLRSGVRQLLFGPEAQFEKYLGYKVAAFEATGYRPRDELTYVMYTEVGRQVARFSLRGDRTMFLFIFADEIRDRGEAGDSSAQKAVLRTRFGKSGWECPQILEWLDRTDSLYFDCVSQIRMKPSASGGWSRGRVSLVGDAACCVSFLAGQGSALAMIAAYILAGELHRAQGDFRQAFARYENLFGPFVLKKQKAALRFAGAFAPKTKCGLCLRNQVMNLMRLPWVTDLVVSRDIVDKIALPEY
jgi:2-polyprenyl-6-methoxyphenol hydroxylase-like FAD-dependent oxidoreductase